MQSLRNENQPSDGCPAEQALCEIAEGRATLAERPEIERHLADCAACRSVLACLQSVSSDTPEREGQTEHPAAGLATVAAGRYQLRREIGRGGMGCVYEAWDAPHGRRVAIKLLLRTDLGSMRRFVREARIGARLSHPAIVTVYEAGRWENGEPFLAMKLIDGKTLGLAVAQCSSMGERIALLPHLIAAIDAIAYAHEQGVIHRDLKPANILLGAFGETMVIDWGLATDSASLETSLPGAGSDEAHSNEGGAVGTPGYMAPELLKGPADARADVFSLGATLDHLLSKPIAGVESSSLPAPARPKKLLAIARKATAVLPHQRYPTAAALAAELRKYLLRRSRSRVRTAIAIVAVLCAMGAAGAMMLWRDSPSIMLCDSRRKLYGIWDERKRDKVQRALGSDFNRVSHSLDSYAAELDRGFTNACIEARVRRDVPAQIYDAQRDCLEARRHELAQLTNRLAIPANGALADVPRLSPIEPCLHLEASH